MNDTLELAIKKASALPEAAQDLIGNEMLQRIAAFEQLREELLLGIRELDAGLGKELDTERELARLRQEYANRS